VSGDIDNEARGEIAALRDQLRRLSEIVVLQGQRIDQFEAKLEDQDVVVEIALKMQGV
jgi:hypothetical protein